jgi:localization factor PodJL
MLKKSLDNSSIMDAIDARFAALATRLETHGKDESDGAIRALEARLEEISARIDNSANQFSGIDSSLIKSLESQVAGLSAHLSQPGAPLPEFEDISPRLSDIEKSIAESRDSILEAARSAAENAVRSLAIPANDGALAEDLKALETLTRRSDERNAKTFEAIHDTLLKIVDRLGSLETHEPELPALAFANREAAMVSVKNVPSLDLNDALPLPEEAPFVAQEERPVRTPAEAAAAAALAAIDSDVTEEQEGSRKAKSLFGGLARAFASRKNDQQAQRTEPTTSASASEVAPTVNLDEPLNAKSANRPLEPGSGAPDLNAILRRVRDERGEASRTNETDAGKSDFIAAARRAAQAAAAEAEVLKQQSGVKGPVRALRVGDILKKRRKTVLMATTAVALGIAGLQLGSALMSEPPQNVQIEDQTTDTSMDLSVTPEATNDVPEIQGAASVPEIESPIQTAAIQPDLDTPDLPVQPAAPAVEKAEAPAPIVVPANAGPEPLREAAQAGDAKAMFEVATNYAEGRGMNANMAEAAKWYEQAAELGFAPAQYRIGNLYEKGLGVERDIAKSKTWYQLAANQGNASAMHNLAVLFAMGADGVTDNDSATRWFIEAADLGVKDSQFNLGILAAKGVGMPQSLEESYKWFGLVAKTGDKDATAKRDEIATSLRPEQLERARASVELWKAKPLNAEANTVEIPESWQSIDPTPTAGIDVKKAMQNIQTYLNKNGYDAGKPDGLAGQKTKAAIAQFQKDNDMPATGEIDEKFVRALIARK